MGKKRSDGWTGARQLRFLDVLARTRSVTRAAAAAGMSRESAHRLRKRDPAGLFALAWARCFPPTIAHPAGTEVDEGHGRAMMRARLEGRNRRRRNAAALSTS